MSTPVFRVSTPEDHERVSALFLGPRAENHDLLRRLFDVIVDKQYEKRRAYFPDDPDFITTSIQDAPAYADKVNELQDKLTLLLNNLGDWSLPFYSPRYSAHMAVDQNLPAILGYLSTMFYNPNNVAFEGGPYTTQLEILAGQQLCKMMGYDVTNAWGHITCDGTVANLEAIWAARNLKFYPFSLRDAIEPGKELDFISDTFNVALANGTTKLLKDCTNWELLNLPVSVVIEIPDRLQNEYSISSKYLESSLSNYLIQTTGKDALMKKWSIETEPVLIIPSTKHYSWPKGAALAGIGSGNAINIEVDVDARMNIDKLRDYLLDCIDKQRAVYQVVAVMGTTEEGAVDRLVDIVQLRDDLKAKGLSFAVHADAAWGGYFASMLPPTGDQRGDEPFIPYVGLKADTVPQLQALKDTDSITIDPHKAGYVPYPAGGLCYKDGRMRYLVTWTAPYIDQGTVGESIGVYGVEGSKPGAAASAVYLAHQVIGTNPDGYGVLLGEASFTCRRFSSHWAAMSTDTTSFIVVPFNRLPSEIKDPSDTDAINKEKQFIRDHILNVANADLVNDTDAMTLLNQLGSDLCINAFACNFRYSDGTVNKDVEEANWLNHQIFERLSVTSPDEDPLSVPFYLTSTTFTEADYGECVREFKKRLGLEGSQDLLVLRNVVQSPFTTTGGFLRELRNVFQTVLEEEVENARRRNEETPGKHTFVVQGTNKLYLVHEASFHMASGRRQIILTANLSDADLQKYTDAKAANPSALVTLQNANDMLLDDITDGKDFNAIITFPDQQLNVDVTNVKIIKKRSLDSEDFSSSYPSLMPFYLYGTVADAHVEHALLLAPNIQLSAGSVQLKLNNSSITDADLAAGVIAIAQDIREKAMQPFPTIQSTDVPADFFFKKGYTFQVKIYRDPFPASTLDPIDIGNVTELLGEGSITITGGDVYVDSDKLNADEEIPQKRTNAFSTSAKQKWVDAVNLLDQQLSQ